MGFLLSKLLPLALYPLGLSIALLLIGLAAGPRRGARGWITAGLGLLWLAAMPWTSRQLLWQLEERASRMTPDPIPTADAVLVLGGGLRPQLPPRRLVEVGEAGDRLIQGVDLVRRGRAQWLVVSGGRVSFTAHDPSPPEARSAASLAELLGVPAARILRSEQARNTAEEAQAIGELARERGWQRLLLVTSATHLPRSVATFRRLTDLTIVPVACDFQLPERRAYGQPSGEHLLLSVLPSADALATTTMAIKEHLGQLAYRLRGWS